MKKALREAAGLQELREDIIDRSGWIEEPDKFDAVDWPMHARAQRTLVRHRKVMVMKLQHDQLATMYRRYWTTTPKKPEDDINPRCPRCSDIQDVNETMNHVWMCPCEAALEERWLQWLEGNFATDPTMQDSRLRDGQTPIGHPAVAREPR
jgi:hypothetical protein